ncbi:MAG: hypothetical protein QOH57_1498 [Mycobacterium sp.]|jgi:hypothetical protein|nr:hypothetical protein [Mycobacterium sp.]
MNRTPLKRRVPVIIGAIAITSMGLITAGCGGGEKGPESSTTTTTTTPPVSSTENKVDPNGPNSFTPAPVPIPAPAPQNPHPRGGDPAH